MIFRDAKSNIIFISHDESDMGNLEAEVRKIETDGLLWGVTKKVPIPTKQLSILFSVEDIKVWNFLIEKINALLEKKFPNVEIGGFERFKVRICQRHKRVTDDL